jgi:hypothetical protein
MPITSNELSRSTYTGLFANRRQVSAYNDTNRAAATGDGTAVTVQFNAEYVDASSNFDTSTFSYTAPEAGTYLVTGAIRYSGLAAGHTTGVLDIVTTARSYRIAFNPGGARDAGNLFTIEFTQLVVMAASATISISTTISGSTKTVQIDGAAAGGPAVTALGIVRVA